MRHNLLPTNQEHKGKPILFLISALGSFMCLYTTHGTNGFTSHPKDEALLIDVLSKDTGVDFTKS